MPRFSLQEKNELSGYVYKFREWYHENIVRRLNGSLASNIPSDIKKISNQIDEISKILERYANLEPQVGVDAVTASSSDEEYPVAIADAFIPLLSRIILYNRKLIAQTLEPTRMIAIHPEAHYIMDDKLSTVEKYMAREWFEPGNALKLPTLSEYVNANEINAYIKKAKLSLGDRFYDEKFGLLMSPALFRPDLEYYLQIGEMKGAEMCVAYMDIDNFKSFNVELGGESKVDRMLLPYFMRFLDAHFYEHGFVYRYGGDEYIALVPFISEKMAVAFLSDLKEKLSVLKIKDVGKKLTLSIGLFHFACDTPFISREIEEKANGAKTYAKTNGKNRIAMYHENLKSKADAFEIVG